MTRQTLNCWEPIRLSVFLDQILSMPIFPKTLHYMHVMVLSQQDVKTERVTCYRP